VIAISEAMRGAIEHRVAEFLREDDPRLRRLWEMVMTRRALPLYVGWLATIALCPDGTFLERLDETDEEIVRELTDPFWQRIALCAAVQERYPELAPLLPARPAHSRDCTTCEGGVLPRFPPAVLCLCGGLGWLLPGEPTPGPGAG
jgi:hypothetical protein